MPAAAVDVSDSSVKYIQLAASKEWEGYEIVHHGIIPLAAGIVVGGSLEKPEALAAVLEQITKQTKNHFVRLSLPEEHAYIFETAIRRDTKPDAVRSAIELKLEENVPLPPREAIFDYECEPDEFNNKNIRVVVTAYSRALIEKYSEACTIAGVVPVAFEVEAEALARAVVSKEEKGAALILDFGATRTGIGIIENHILRYTSTIEVGSRDMFAAIQKKDSAMNIEEFLHYSSQEGLANQRGRYYAELEETVGRVVKELTLRLQYWENQIEEKQKPNISKIIICGGAANMKGIAAYFAAALGVPVAVADVWQNVFSTEDFVPGISFADSMGYAISIGLALGDMQ